MVGLTPKWALLLPPVLDLWKEAEAGEFWEWAQRGDGV